MTNTFDVLILGGGPIGASTAYALSKKEGLKIGILTAEPENTDHAAYKYAGGSIRTYWDDPLKVEMTETTSTFIKELDEKGVDVSLHHDTYLFLNRGVSVPSINVNGGKLVQYLLQEAQSRGVEIINGEQIQKVDMNGLEPLITTDNGTYSAKKVLCALGAQNDHFMPELELEKEERYLMVLDTEVPDSMVSLPHTILPLADGVVYLFIKKMPEGYRLLVGQEDVLPIPEKGKEQAHFSQLLEMGLGSIMPFLSSAKVEKTSWGTDVGNKTLLVKDHAGVLFSANCGSAIRSCIWIGNKMAEILA